MSLFERVFTGPSSEHFPDAFTGEAESDTAVIDLAAPRPVTSTPPSSFSSYIKTAILHGSEQARQAEDRTPPAVEDQADDDLEDLPNLDYSYDSGQIEDHASDYEEEIEDDLPGVASYEEEAEHEPAPLPLVRTESTLARQQTPPNMFQATSAEQKDDVQVQRIVDGLFDRMRVVWGNNERQDQVAEAKEPPPPRKTPVPTKKATQEQHYPLAQSKTQLAQLIRREVPQAVRGELVAVLRTEIVKVVRGEIVRILREELETFTQAMTKNLDRLSQIETRIARIEGAVDREIQVNFPKGAVQIEGPTINVPEREVKVAAPVNVQPPSVTFDEGAISVHFNKSGGGKKEVRFERDPHDNCVKSAEIIDVGGK